MSIQNRKIEPGAHTITEETKVSQWKGRLYCFFKGHKEVKLQEKDYCICCWKEIK